MSDTRSALVNGLWSEISRLDCENMSLRKTTDRLTKENDVLKKDLSDMFEKFEKLFEDSGQIVKEKNERLKSIEEKLIERCVEFDRLNLKNRELNRDIDDMSLDLSESIEEIGMLKNENECLKKAADRLSSELQSIELDEDQEHAELVQENVDLRDRIETMERESTRRRGMHLRLLKKHVALRNREKRANVPPNYAVQLQTERETAKFYKKQVEEYKSLVDRVRSLVIGLECHPSLR